MMKNPSILLKVCGMRDAKNILEIASLKPDFMGFIFYPPSPRYVGKDFALPQGFPDEIKRVGVFVNESTREIERVGSLHSLDVIQLHGDESPVQCQELRRLGYQVMKVFHVDNQFDFRSTEPYNPVVDFFMFDTKTDGYGGSGRTFDWSVLESYRGNIPFFLSGGLSKQNMGQLDHANSALMALDINSGVETSPGIKSISLVKEFISEINKV